MHYRSLIAVVAFAAPVCAVAQAPTWTAEQTAVWTVVARSWADEVANNGRWPGAYVHERVIAWDADWPAPRDRASLEKWARFGATMQKTLEYEVTPVAISVVGDTAVAYYTYVQMTQRASDKPEREAGVLAETLVRDRGEWKYLSLSGFKRSD
jgi:hypothetical protein